MGPAYPGKGQGSTLSMKAEEGTWTLYPEGEEKIIHLRAGAQPCSPGPPVSEDSRGHTLGDPHTLGEGQSCITREPHPKEGGTAPSLQSPSLESCQDTEIERKTEGQVWVQLGEQTARQ